MRKRLEQKASAALARAAEGVSSMQANLEQKMDSGEDATGVDRGIDIGFAEEFCFKEGWVLKRTEWKREWKQDKAIKKWDRRFLRLTTEHLQWFKAEGHKARNAEGPAGQLALVEVTVQLWPKFGKHRFRLVTESVVIAIDVDSA
eukprot:SAG31_NODE_15641_length_745_cov_0.959752_1_plen_144_part_01